MAPVIVAKQLGQGKQVCEIAKLEPCTRNRKGKRSQLCAHNAPTVGKLQKIRKDS